MSCLNYFVDRSFFLILLLSSLLLESIDSEFNFDFDFNFDFVAVKTLEIFF